jgi:autotransporter-associated beta strand protein
LAVDDVVINEVQVSNGSTLLDEDDEYADWVELLNRGPETVNLAGWGLSDRTNSPMKWVFPPRQLAPGERQLVFASGKDRTNAFETALIASPLEVPGLVLWLKADAESRTNGEQATGWADLSGYGNHAFTTNGAACPTYRTNAVNGHAAMRFTRAAQQQFLLPTNNFNGLDSLRDVTVMVVCRWGGAAVSGLFGGWKSGALNTHFEISSGGQIRLRIAALDSVRSNGVMTANAWCHVSGVMSSSGDTPIARVFRDGLLCGSFEKDPGAALLSSYSHVFLGNSDSNARFFDGDMAEVLIFSRGLSAADREAVERYLADRYGLPFQGGAAVPELHASFSLDAEGETLVLSRPGSNVVDSVALPDVPEDASYGRCPDGAGAFAFLAEPTPGAANSASGFGAPLKKPDFSRKRGFCDAPFELTLSPDEVAAPIYYTLDGSEPAPTNGSLYASPLQIETTTVVRAMAYLSNALPHRAIATHTYLFLDNVLGQAARPADYPADWNGYVHTSYGISTNVAAQPGYADALRAALKAVPVLALSLSKEDMFGTSGVYANPTIDGFERVVSAEWLTNGAGQVQLDAALRVQGGASRIFSNTPKKSLRLLFRDALGEERLKKPVLASGGTELADFNTLILRAEYNNAWTHTDGTQRLRGSDMRDQWMRDTQLALSGSGSHGNHVQLFVNGLYWGLYNVSERPDAAFAANYFGGEREDYDAMTHSGIRDGDNVAWNAMLALARGGLATQAKYEALRQYLDIDHFIDYMIVNIYAGNEDWPFNNWNAVRRRAPGAGYLFYCWDAERTLEGTTANRSTVTGSNNPAEFYAALRANGEFRLRFADRLHRAFFNDGALTPSNAAIRYVSRAAQVETAVYGEVARWGAYRREVTPGGTIPRYGTNEWVAERNRLLTAYFPVRTGIVLEQFRATNLYAAVSAPEFSQHGGTLEFGALLGVVSTQGVAYVTFDGSDPRVAYTGEVASNAAAYAGPFAVTNAGLLKARALTNGVWSALTEAAFGVVVSEPVFQPPGDGDWGVATNWLGAVVPQGAGRRVKVNAPSADRNVELRAPVTVGQIAFNHAGNAYRNRVRDRGTGNALTFDGGAGPARISVAGDGAGYAEFEIVAGVVLRTDVELAVQHLAGSPDYGALRLREAWSGPGGLRKTGPGVAALNGEGKTFMGPVLIDEGVLIVTGPAAPAQAAGVTVASGGQLRLTSASSPGEPRVYAFGGAVAVSGYGRGAEIPDSAGQGKLGALRYDPATQSNVCVLATPVLLRGAADIHVDGSQNRLDLAGGVSGGSLLVKTGGGLLAVPDGTALTAAVQVANGTLAAAGDVSLGPLTGAGAVRVDGAVIAVPSAEGVALEAVLRQPGEDALPNGLVRVAQAPGMLGRIRLYLPGAGDLFRGALFAPLAADLAAVLRGSACEVYAPDAAGTNAFDGVRWSLRADAQVVAVPAVVDFGGGPVAGRVVEVRLGAAPASYGAWRLLSFVSEADRTNAAVSGPLAAPLGDGVANLERYAFGLGWEAPASGRFPSLVRAVDGWDYRFAFDPGRDDVACVVEATEDLSDWSAAERVFDSRADNPERLDEGWLTLRDARLSSRRFYRLRLILSGAE